MKGALLYLSLCGLAWAQSELQPHYRKAKQKCVGDHQIMLKGRHSKHGFYIFNYVYSSAVPNNQTQFKKEEDNRKNISSATHGPDRKNEPRKPTDNLTDTTQETRADHKHLDATGNGRKFEDRRTTESSHNLHGLHGNTTNWDLRQHHLELTIDKEGNEIATGDNTVEIDGSGDIGFPSPVDTHHGIVISNEYHDRVRDHQDTRGVGNDTFLGKEKDVKSGIFTNTKPSKDRRIKIGVKENDASVIQETDPYHYIPKKIDGQSKAYSKVSLKGKTNATNEESGYIDLLDKSKVDNRTAKLSMDLKVQAKVSEDLLKEAERIRIRGNHTNVLDNGEIKMANEKGISSVTVHTKGKDGYTMIIRKLNGQKDGSGVTEPHKKGDVKDSATSGSHAEVAVVTKVHKNDGTREDVINGRSNVHGEVPGITKLHKKDGAREDVINGRSNIHREVPGSTKLHKKDGTREDVINGRSNIHGEVPGATKLHEKHGTREDVINGRSSSHMEAAGISKSHYGEIGAKGRLINQVEDPDDTKANRTNQSGAIISMKLDSHVDRPGVINSHSKGELTILSRISSNQMSDPGAIKQGQKSPSGVDLINRKSNTGKEGFDSTKTQQKEVGSYEKISRNAHGSKLGDPKMHENGKTGFGVTFQKVSGDTVEGTLSYKKATGDAVDLKRSNLDSSNKNKEHSGQKPIQFKSALSVSHGSHDNIQHTLNIPKSDNLQNREHSLATVKSNKKVIQPSKKASKVNTGTYGSRTAKQYHGYLGSLRRKSSRRDKKRQSVVHTNDSSQSSESEENSRQSYEDYQNDKPGSYQSTRSVEDLSAESNESDDHTQMEDQKTSSQEDSWEQKSTA
ncbi:matrix extracellular phosphoglycoprotein isoform X2 [Rhineura floridana]|nr:matrix extracellular phosphoglycoprotein isoform X2 [Rhineura floridana]XP_061440722.1 matrix extracellular phosphoglycoprotein isoform X2 [Rhineura floridana]XP_061440723.1 matrix extracellular phosphoglycoprotein isoform X2 [Rhineura floridana]